MATIVVSRQFGLISTGVRPQDPKFFIAATIETALMYAEDTSNQILLHEKVQDAPAIVKVYTDSIEEVRAHSIWNASNGQKVAELVVRRGAHPSLNFEAITSIGTEPREDFSGMWCDTFMSEHDGLQDSIAAFLQAHARLP